MRKNSPIFIAATIILLILSGLVSAAFMILNYTSNIIHEEIMMLPEEITSAETPAKAITNPDREIRGVWIASVSNINYPSKKGLSEKELKEELNKIVANCVELNLNTIFFQVRPSSDALYKSDIFPASEFVSGKQGDGSFDSLAYLLDLAHKNDIDVHAWINPLRVTGSGSEAYKQKDTSLLADSNPAKLHPEWTLTYDDLIYYNAGIPEVRQLIADGVAELVNNYDINGIVFDDYFYPYPVAGCTLEDSETYSIYGGEMNIEDWRRENVNSMVKLCYDTVKSIDNSCRFGIAPCGIWQNSSNDNGGSDTRGFEAYSEIYCDALAWISGGYIDYIAPQIYWQFTTSAARFDTLVRWWNAQLDEYDNIDLLICHAAYRSAEWGTENEIRNQIEYARSERSYKGSLLYGYAAIEADDMGLKEQLKTVYSDEIIYSDIASNGVHVSVSSPASGSYINEETTYIIGCSDPAYPLYVDGKSVSRTKNGYFSLYVSLKKGENKFVFTHNGEEIVYIINRGSVAASTASGPSTLESFSLTSLAPIYDCMLPSGSEITIKATAPAGSVVTAEIAGQKLTLTPTLKQKGTGLLKEIYIATLTLPDVTDGQIEDYGKIIYTAEYNGEKLTVEGSRIRSTGKDSKIAVEVINSDSELKISETSWYYDDYTPAQIGMRDYAVSQKNGYYKLRFGGYISDDDVMELPDTDIPLAQLYDAEIISEINGKYTYIKLGVSENIPVNGYVADGKFVFTLLNVNASTAKIIKFTDNPLFSDITGEKHPTLENAYKYYLTLKNIDNFYGYEFAYEDGKLIVMLRNPQKLSESTSFPLSGKTIILDAGHGGYDNGAAGPDGRTNESDLNLSITKAAAEKLIWLGAEVILIRDDDTAVELLDRCKQLSEINPDLCISVHQNSMGYSSDITKIRGLLGLYFADSGKLLTECVSRSVSDSLNRYMREPSKQRLAMVRNAKFPSTLIEVGFITCIEEYDLLMSENGINSAAQGIADGILEYYRIQATFLE